MCGKRPLEGGARQPLKADEGAPAVARRLNYRTIISVHHCNWFKRTRMLTVDYCGKGRKARGVRRTIGIGRYPTLKFRTGSVRPSGMTTLGK